MRPFGFPSSVAATAVLCLAACSSSPASPSHDGSPPDAPSDGVVSSSSTVTIGPGGGTVSVGGASVVIPAGALSAPMPITVAVATDAPPLPGGTMLAGRIFAFTPHGQPFNALVTINVPFTAPATGTPQLFVASADDELWSPITIATAADGVFSVQVSHFSYFGPMIAASSTCGQIGHACGPGTAGCCYDPNVVNECDTADTLICVTAVGGPCQGAGDCWQGHIGNTDCILGRCCSNVGFSCNEDAHCCSNICNAPGSCGAMRN